MKKTLAFLILGTLSLLSCTSNKKKKENTLQEKETTKVVVNKKGYALMRQKCFICHMEKPDPSTRGSMLAPPMVKVQEHYKPNYKTKEAFIKAVTQWVQNPNEDNTLMPGAIRKFNVMPQLPYEEADIKLIAATLYDIDFGDMPKMNHKKNNGLQLNEGKKWKISAASKEKIKTVINELTLFTENNVKAYNQLGKKVFNNAKTILLDKSVDVQTFNQLHNFFNNVEQNMHLLIAANNITSAKKQQEILKTKFAKFFNFFE